jgi:hypothetical protein
MQRHSSALTLTAIVATLFAPAVGRATGLGNLTYTAAELEKPIANFGATGSGKFPAGPPGSNTVLMLRDVLVIPGSNDSGKPPLSFNVFDVKDPRNPKLLKSVTGGPELSSGRELHAMPVAMINGKDVLAFPTQTGVMFFDFTDPMNPTAMGTLALAGVNGGDYDNAAWMLSWVYPYLYAGGTGNGVYIIDATDPAHASLVTKVATGSLGNFRIGPTYGAGNYLVVAQMDQATSSVSVLDVGNPAKPFLLATGKTSVSLYSAVVIGDQIYGAGTNGDYAFMKWSPTAVTMMAQTKSGSDRGGYCTYQSGFAICGQSSEGYKKWDLHNMASVTQVGHGTDPQGVGGDFDFATIVGNLVYLGNDHGSGAALIPHTMAPDSTAPEVVKVYPNDGDTKQPTTSRVTVFFSEDIDLGTVSNTNIFVRKMGGTALDGTFSKSSFNAISFGPKAPLEANATYEVVIPAGGLKDLVGNTIATAAMARFSTGASVAPGGGGGAGVVGTGGAGGKGAGGTSGGTGGGAPAGGTTGSSTGGASSSGGGTATGGSVGAGTGGATVVLGTGGASGGSPGSSTGGSAGPGTSSGGSTGSTGSGGAAVGMAAGSAAGCACNVPGGSNSTGGGVVSLLGLALVLGARRDRRRRNTANKS